MKQKDLSKKAFALSLLDDSAKHYDRALQEYLKDPAAALKKFPHWEKDFLIDSAVSAQQKGHS